MDLVNILDVLWRRRLLVLAAGIVALAVGVLSAYRVSPLPPKLESRQYQVGLASASVLVDTPESQVVDVDPEGTDTLGLRANLLASLMAEGAIKTEIARRARIPLARLLAVAQSPAAPDPQLPSGDLKGTYILTIRPDDVLPIIKINAHASDARRAAALANAAMGGLQSYLASKALAEKVSNARRLVVTRLGPAKAGQVVRGPRRTVALGAAVFLFLAACAAIVVVSSFARSWRQAHGSTGMGEPLLDLGGDPLGGDPLAWPGAEHPNGKARREAEQKLGSLPRV